MFEFVVERFAQGLPIFGLLFGLFYIAEAAYRLWKKDVKFVDLQVWHFRTTSTGLLFIASLLCHILQRLPVK